MRLPVVVCPESEGTDRLLSETRDVSSRGVYFIMDRDLPLGSPIEVWLTLPEEITHAGPVRVRCQGHIIRIEEKLGDDRQVGVATIIDHYKFMRPEEATH